MLIYGNFFCFNINAKYIVLWRVSRSRKDLTVSKRWFGRCVVWSERIFITPWSLASYRSHLEKLRLDCCWRSVKLSFFFFDKRQLERDGRVWKNGFNSIFMVLSSLDFCASRFRAFCANPNQVLRLESLSHTLCLAHLTIRPKQWGGGAQLWGAREGRPGQMLSLCTVGTRNWQESDHFDPLTQLEHVRWIQPLSLFTFQPVSSLIPCIQPGAKALGSTLALL